MISSSLNRAYTGMPEDEQDPYRMANDSTAQDPNLPPTRSEEEVGRPAPVETQPTETSKAEEPVKTAAPSTTPRGPEQVRLEPKKTFAQMREAGEARPPAPTATMGSGEPPPPAIIDKSRIPPTLMTDVPPNIPDETGFVGYSDVPQTSPKVSPAVAPTPTTTRTSDALLSLLTGGAQGTNQTPLQAATNAKLLDRLNSSSPYDSDAVRSEYDYLAGNIDDQFAMDSRALDEGMARRGLYGSTGKDFHSGRLSDLNVGRRSAKISLAQDLANKFATTKGQYDTDAITQAENATNASDANQRSWLNQLMGYGQDAFTNDLATAEFNQRQNESEQDFLMRMLAMGYGV